MDRKSTQLPRTPLQFYVRLYCKRKGKSSLESRNAVVEATKSWLSMNSQERLTIMKKFQDSNANYKNKFANFLKSAEPYLKKKKCKRPPSAQSTNKSQEVAHSNNLVQGELEQSLLFQNGNQECPTANDSITSIPTDIEDIPSKTETAVTSNQEQPAILEEQTISIPEPVPPNISNAQELYNVIKESGQTNWCSLTELEKKRYQKAVLILKKQYINKYKDYLQSLPIDELFNYYIKNIN